MNEHEFAKLLGELDPELVARADAPARRAPHLKIALVAAVAVLLILTTALTMAIIAFFPQTYDLDYEIPKHELANKAVQIYYTAEDGKIKRQSVLLPPTAENVFLTWLYLNELDRDIALLQTTSTEGSYQNRQVKNIFFKG